MRRALFIMLTAMLIAGSMEWPLACSPTNEVPNCCKGGVCMMKMHRDTDGACMCSADALSKDMLVAVRGILVVPTMIAKPDFLAFASVAGDSPLDHQASSIERPPRWSA